MIEKTLNIISDTVDSIKAKNNNKSNFDLDDLHTFEFKFFLCLEIVRFELQLKNQISDLTADALNQLFTFQCFEYYYRDFPNIYKKCSELSCKLSNYNEKWKNHKLKGKVGIDNEKWSKYYCVIIKNLLSVKKI